MGKWILVQMSFLWLIMYYSARPWTLDQVIGLPLLQLFCSFTKNFLLFFIRCKIDWKKGKNLTVKTIKKKQKHKGSASLYKQAVTGHYVVLMVVCWLCFDDNQLHVFVIHVFTTCVLCVVEWTRHLLVHLHYCRLRSSARAPFWAFCKVYWFYTASQVNFH